MGLYMYRQNSPNLPVPSHKAQVYQILHVALSIGLYQECVDYSSGVKFGTTLGIENNFSPSLGSYVLNQFQSIVMSGIKGFYILAIGAI